MLPFGWKVQRKKVLTFSAITWEISFQHTSAFIAHNFFSLLSNPRLVITVILLYDTLQMSVFQRLSQWSTHSGGWRSFLSSVCTDWCFAPLVSHLIFWKKCKNDPYVQRNQPYLMTFMDTVQCRRIIQPFWTSWWFLTKQVQNFKILWKPSEDFISIARINSFSSLYFTLSTG